MKRVTVIVAEALMMPANHVRVMLGKSTHFNTHSAANWQDAEGNLYSVSSGLWSDTQMSGVQTPDILAQLVASERVPEGVDLALAAQAQAAFVLHEWGAVDEAGELVPPPVPSPATITAIVGDDPKAILASFGLVSVEPVE